MNKVTCFSNVIQAPLNQREVLQLIYPISVSRPKIKVLHALKYCLKYKSKAEESDTAEQKGKNILLAGKNVFSEHQNPCHNLIAASQAIQIQRICCWKQHHLQN